MARTGYSRHGLSRRGEAWSCSKKLKKGNLMSYLAAIGSILRDDDADKYGKRISALAEQNSGCVTPEIVLEDARNRSSPLHDFFEWNNNAAAEKYRLDQARYLLRSVHIEIKGETVRAFYHVTVKDDEPKQYITAQRAMTEAEYRQQVIAQALKELNSLREKYKQYKELSRVFEAIDTL